MSDAGLPAVTGNEIAIVAMAGRFPGARDVEAFWRNLREGVESIRFFTDDEMAAAGLDPATFRHPDYVPARGVVDGADELDAELFGFSAAEARVTDPQQRVFLECCWEALERAGYDSERFRRPIGVYAGVGASGYGFHVYADSALVGAVGEFQALLGNDKDYLASRVAYKLDLTGPAVVIQTACSTSLVAIHFACQGLLTGECDLALAGGVAIKFPQESGYLHREGGIGSPDGHCRAFDADARGTVGSSGVGVVALKRLEDVAADGDQVLAVIRGSAVNNDGGAKIGYTAPAIGGQSRVVRLAHAVAEVDPATIGYVETHGTGTALGDPIEIAALEQAFRSGGCEGRGFCSVGSVKTNIGHLDTAAGVAGVIKTVQALRHGEIPPSLHFEAPNPEIPFAESCFRVNAVLSPWERTGGPRRAGVSSFGIGGTNAHVVLEEAPPRPAGSPAPGPHLLLLAARTASALDVATRRLADHLEAHPDEALADVAYTLQVGRRRLAHRRAILVEEGADPVAALRTPGPRRSWSRTSAATARPVVFLLPGQGSQHVGMARGLYAAEPRFRESFDRCAALLEPLLGLDLREVLWPPGVEEGDASAEARLRRSELAQPALFAVEYSLARLWMEWGVEPAAMVGHSVGELVAACLAGTFGLDDALRLIVLRGRLVQGCSEGDMLGVSLSEEEIRRHLPEDGSVSVAVVNGPAMVVLSGAQEAIAGVEGVLAADGVPTRRLHTSHAFHSPAMEPAVEPFVEAVAGVEREAPAIPFFSNLTGRRVTSEEAIDPSYWGRHLRETVRFGDGLAAALAASDAVLLEVGPGNVLGTLARRHPGLGEDRPVISTLGHAKARDGAADREDDRVSLRAALARLWLAGVPIDWDRVHGESRRRVLLPTYPFERRRYTVRPGAGAAPGAGVEVVPAEAPSTADAGAGRPSLDTPFVAPSGELEGRVAGIWEELLGVAPIGRHDDFFELGGHSLLAIQVATRLGERTGRRVPLQALLEHPTVAELAERVAASEESEAEDDAGAVRLVPDPERRSEPFPLTDLQQAYWIGRGEDVELGGVSTHVYLELDTVGLDLDRLQRALDRLVDRHDMLRAVVREDGTQRILPEVPPYRIATLDLRGVGDAATERALADVRGDMSHQVLPADRCPLFEVRATLRSGDRARIHVSFDFLIGDAWSWRLLNLELMRFYLEPDAALPPITISFRDYVLAERTLVGTETHRRALEFWRERLATLPPAPELPRAPAAPATLATSATGRHFTRRSAGLDADAWESLRRRGARRGLTPSGLVAAAFCEVLAAWSRRSRFTLNLTQFNRQPLHPEVGSLVGDFTSVLLLAVDGSDGATFEDRARRLQAGLWEGLQHRAVTGVQVLRELARLRGTGAAPTMPVVFTSILNLGVESEDADAERRFADRVPETAVAYSISQTPQVLLDHQASERAGALFYNWDAVDEAYPAGLLDDLFAAYGDLLARLAAGDEAWRAREPVRAETAAVVREPEPEAPARNLLELLDRGREAGEDRVAVVAGDRVITHGGLARRARHLAARLVDPLAEHRAESGAVRERPVAVVMEKGWEQIVAVAAILEAGAPYLPIDARLPADHIRTLLAQGDVRIALTQERLDPEIGWPEGDGAVTRLVVPAREEEPEPVPAGARSRPAARAGADELAYVLFTSGSTGVPKGVMIEHRAAANTIEDVDRRYSVGADDRVLGLSSLSFDLSVYDLFGPLAAGGAIVLPEPDAARDPSRWAALMETGRVTVWNSVPALLEMLVEHAELDRRPLPASLRTVLLSGDWLPVKLPDRLRAAASGPVEITSLGGATEAAIWSVLFPVGEVDPGWPSIPYGRGMERQRLEVLDERLAPRPLWATGEIFIAGAGLARGYWRDPARTATSFVPHPVTGERLYRTGDLGRRLPSGDIEFLGREDTQVKVGGHRIELGEIEAVLARHPSVAACAVVARGERTRRRLVAYVVLRGGEPAGSAPLSDHLASKLPAHMVPPTFVRLDALPLTANGKVDRAALPPPGEAPASLRRPPSTPAEKALAAIWSELLDVAEPGADDSFFELGGDSVLTLQLVGRAAREGIPITASQVFRNRTLAELAAGADDPDAPAAPAGDGPVPVPRDGELPLSFGQERLWFLDQLSGAPVQNIPAALRLRGELDPAALSSALSAVVRRHEALRTAFPDADGVPRQEIAPPLPVPLPVIDLRALPEAAREAEARRRALAAGRRRFDLTRPPLLWAELVRLEDGEHVLTCSVSHVVSDGWSMVVLIREVAALYAARLAGRPSPLPEPPIQYADFAVWQRRWLAGEEAARRLEHWRRRLAGFEALELPLDRPRPPRGAHRGGTRTLDLSPALTAGFRAVLERHGATLFTGCLALLAVLLFRLTGRTDLVIGADVAERDRRELEGLIGLFVNQLVLRLDLAGDPGLGEVLERARGVVGEAFDHGGIPFQRLVEASKPPRRVGEHPFFQVKLVLQAGPQGGAEPSLPGLETSPYDLDYEVTQLDLILFVWERGDTLRFSLQYARDLFEPATVDRMVRLVDESIERLVSDEETRLSALRDDRGGGAHQEKTMKTKLGSFKAIQPKPVDLSKTEAVSFDTPAEWTGPARVARPAGEGVDLAEWAATHRERLDQELAHAGAVLFRGFGIDTPENLERLAGAVCGDFFSENGEHVAVSGNVYTPVFYAPEMRLLWHNENSFNHSWPSKIWFACARPAAEGGETPVVDSREVYRRLPPEVREPFEEKGVMYVRNYGSGLGLDWRAVFRTDDKAEVERVCEQDRFELEWRDNDRLRTRCVRPAVVRHPSTGEPSWFNQAQHFHVACLDPETRESLSELLAPEDFPRACYFGDGSEIPDDFMTTILDVYREIELAFPWQKGDVMLVDNILAAHGRNPFRGERKILVTMGDMMSYDEIESV